MKAIDILKGLVAEQLYLDDETPFKPKYVWVSTFEDDFRSALHLPEADGSCCGDAIDWVKGNDPKKVMDRYFGQDKYRIIDGVDTPWGSDTKWIRVDADLRWYDEDAEIVQE